jgi:PPOX class probable F420-dependent enzyme
MTGSTSDDSKPERPSPGASPPWRRFPAALSPPGRAFGSTWRSRDRGRSAPSSVAEIRACKRSLLVTYRRDGTSVPTPVWAAESGGSLYVRTERTAGKVKRLHNDPRLLVAPCTVRGRLLGARSRRPLVLPRADEHVAERVLAARYGWGCRFEGDDACGWTWAT